MKVEEIHSIIQQAAQAWMTGNADAFAELFAPDGKFIVPGNSYVGRTAIQQVTAEFAATHSGVKIEIKQILIDGDRAAVEWTWEDTNNETGKQQKAEDAILVDFKEGLITRWREYIDSNIPSNSGA
ncbi:SgcJ/EcaC family oxidoreductase [Chlorogloeopsis sp. ULAP02]|uniref:nuclear transport factor 2 family protein n=1 Tax=Chlorogloeopsis sp. ULAP02 TaxID=3107926 RepID=UPI0031373628